MFVVVQVRLSEGMTEAETRHERRDAESQHVCLRLTRRRAAYSTSSTVVRTTVLATSTRSPDQRWLLQPVPFTQHTLVTCML